MNFPEVGTRVRCGKPGINEGQTGQVTSRSADELGIRWDCDMISTFYREDNEIVQTLQEL
jgi:isopentenyldiphosphate isomerase